MRNFLLIISVVLFCASCDGDLNLTVPLVKDTPTGQGSGNPAVPDNEIVFTPAQLKLPKKKGACFTLPTEAAMGKPIALKGGWNYSWGPNLLANQPVDMEFVPMFWSMHNDSSVPADIQKVRSYIIAGKCKRLLGFNEPDASSQANMSVELALSRWPYLQSLRVPLGSPAATSAEGPWLEEFMRKAKERNYRVDYICVHSYPGGSSAVGFKAMLGRVYAKFQKPILVTEFAMADWTEGVTVATNKFTAAQALTFMKDALPFLESTPYVIGYCWFSFSPTSGPGAPSALFDADGNLTALGQYYANFTSN